MRELKTYKEEAVAIAIISVLLLLVRWASSNWWPTTGQYDLAAETETVVWTVLRLVIYTSSAWFALRIVLPKGYRWLKNNVYADFDTMPPEQKTSISMRTFALLLLALVLLAMSACNTATAATPVGQRECVVSTALDDVGVREATGHNDGQRVEEFLSFVHQAKGAPWCAAFVSYHLSGCGVRNPATGWSPAFSGVSARVWSPRKATRMPMPGDVFCLYFTSLGRVGHVGIVTAFDGRYISTVEGNTSAPGSREGDGVYARRRELSKVYCISNYILNEAPTTRTRTTGALRLPNAAQRADRYQADHRNGDEAGAARYVDTRATGGRASNAATARTRSGHSAIHQGAWPRLQYAQRIEQQSGRRLRVRYRQHQGGALGQFYADEQGYRDHYQGCGGEVPNACMGVVDACRYSGIHRTADGAGLPQTLLA